MKSKEEKLATVTILLTIAISFTHFLSVNLNIPINAEGLIILIIILIYYAVVVAILSNAYSKSH